MIKNVVILLILASALYYYLNKSQRIEYERHTIKIEKVTEIGSLFVLKKTVSGFGNLGESENLLLMIKGDIYYYVDFDRIKITENKKTENEISILLDKPNFKVSIDENKSGPYALNSKANIDDTSIFEYAHVVEDNLKKVANKEKNIKLARESAKNFIINFLKIFDYKVNKVYWRDLTPETLSEKEKKDLFLDVKYNLIKCKIKTNNSQDSIDLKYKINRNGKIDPLILSKNINPQFAKCIHSSLLNLKHKEFYGKEEKVRKNFDLDKNKMCDFLEKDKILGIPKYYIKLKELNCDSSKSKTTNNTIGGKN